MKYLKTYESLKFKHGDYVKSTLDKKIYKVLRYSYSENAYQVEDILSNEYDEIYWSEKYLVNLKPEEIEIMKYNL